MSEVKQRILKEATRIFTETGLKSVRMDDLASVLGISKRTIYELFGDKENLIYECIVTYHQEMELRAKKITAGCSNIVEEFIVMMEMWNRDQSKNYLVMLELRKYYPRVFEAISQKHNQEGSAFLKEKLSDGIKQGYLLPTIDLDLSIAILAHQIYGIVNKDSIMLYNVSPFDAFKYVITYFFRGIATEKGIKMIDEKLNTVR